MNQDLFEWLLLLVRWLHITVAVTWIGTSIFFMWLDRTFERVESSTNPGHVGEVWMVHGGGFYHVEKLLMGPTKVPDRLHWFKWESYWTWMSGFALMTLIFYLGDGTFLLDSMVSNLTYWQAVGVALFSIFGSWIFYDFVWESSAVKSHELLGHVLTVVWIVGMTFLLCHTISGRAAYLHVGAMLGTMMAGNVYRRIIPRQLLMVEASKSGTPVNQDWAKNAKNRSTHNTYFTLPVIFTMLSNHFPNTYGHEYNWIILLLICLGGACIREYFVVRLKNPSRSIWALVLGIALISGSIVFSKINFESEPDAPVETVEVPVESSEASQKESPAPVIEDDGKRYDLSGTITFKGEVPERKKLNLPAGCAKGVSGDIYSNEILVKNGKLENVLIRITKGLGGKDFKNEIPQDEVELDQKHCMYTPRVVGARVGQKVTFINSDPIFHNVRSVSDENKNFNMAMPRQDQRETKTFTRPEVFLQAKCSVHPWMGAFVAIMDHPFFDVSDASGKVDLKNLPPGQYTVEAWHEVFGTQTKEITVDGKTLPDLNFEFTR